MSDEVNQIVAYPLSDPATMPGIKPASRVRDWQLKTTESFATRCLPLNIANNNGWELVLPGGFDAVYQGGDQINNVEIYPHGDGPSLGASHFGFGVLTFHVNCLFRSPAGVHLQIQGPVNEVRDGIQALSGIIETDWSPYTTTMNWKFTRPGRVRFLKGESFAQISPVPAHYVDRFKARFGDLAQELPEVNADFKVWRTARSEMLHAIRTAGAGDPRITPQNLYYRGYYPDGERKHCEHATRLAPAAFEHSARAQPGNHNASEQSPRSPVTCVMIVDTIDWRFHRLLDDLSDKAGQVIVYCKNSAIDTAALQQTVCYSNVTINAIPPDLSLEQLIQRQAIHDTVLLMESNHLLLNTFWQNLPGYLAQLTGEYNSVSLPLYRSKQVYPSRATLQSALAQPNDLLEPLNRLQGMLVPTRLLAGDFKSNSFVGEDWVVVC